MPSFLSTIPLSALEIAFLTAGSFEVVLREDDSHVKTVPHTIIAQSCVGRYGISCQGRTETTEPGGCFLTPANEELRITHHRDPEQRGRMTARWAHFHFTLFGAIDFTSLLEFPLTVGAEMGERFGVLIGEALEQETRLEAGEESLSLLIERSEIAYRILSLLCGISHPKPEALELLRHSDRLAPVFATIKRHLADPISAGDLARAAHMSLSRFHAFFRERVGRSPMEYLRYMRLTEAGRQMAATARPVYVIAEAVGFRSPFHFSRAFKGRFGVSPTEYRRRARRGVA